MGCANPLWKRIGKIESWRDAIGLRDDVGGRAAEALGYVPIGGEQGIVEDAEAGPQHGLIADSPGETRARIPVVVVGLLHAAGMSVHSA